MMHFELKFKVYEQAIIEYDDTTNAWNEWKHANIVSKIVQHERFILSLNECTKTYSTYKNDFHRIDTNNIPQFVKQMPVIDVHCNVCRKMYGHLYPCRICGKVYHQQCLKIKDCQSIKNSMQSIGESERDLFEGIHWNLSRMDVSDL